MTTTNTAPATIKTVDPIATAAERRAPQIQSRCVFKQATGFMWAEWLVRLPRGFLADDLKEPTVWRDVQADRNTALRMFDRLFLIAWDETWAAEAVVAQADSISAILAKPRIISLAERSTPLFHDDTYRVVWDGVGYFVERKKDNQRMTSSAATPQIAERDLAALYPRTA